MSLRHHADAFIKSSENLSLSIRMPGLERLELTDFRCHPEIHLNVSGTPWVMIRGRNGAGKTSLLEAIYAAARGRSFRTRALPPLIRAGTDEARVLIITAGAQVHRLGVAFHRTAREVHLDDKSMPSLTRVASEIPVEYLGGELYRLIEGTPGTRRRFLDWGLFHVEPRFLSTWRGWFKAHQHRNNLLRHGRGKPLDLAPWTEIVAQYGEMLSAFRASLIEQLDDSLRSFSQVARGAPDIGLSFRRGWRGGSLTEALRASARPELQAGRAIVGPQCDDWQITLAGREGESLSRGQAKLACILLIRARASLMEQAGRTALLLVDDLMADFDAPTARLALGLLDQGHSQIWLSVLEGEAKIPLDGKVQGFHVEPGLIRPL